MFKEYFVKKNQLDLATNVLKKKDVTSIFSDCLIPVKDKTWCYISAEFMMYSANALTFSQSSPGFYVSAVDLQVF